VSVGQHLRGGVIEKFQEAPEFRAFQSRAVTA
jgi:hypothetical protein